jgi:mono/diheme cytochrome c family protein
MRTGAVSFCLAALAAAATLARAAEPAEAPAEAPAPPGVDVAAIYLDRCAICHGRDGRGGAMYSLPIAGKAQAIVKRMILQGSRKMKPVKGIDEATAAALARYVAFLE